MSISWQNCVDSGAMPSGLLGSGVHLTGTASAGGVEVIVYGRVLSYSSSANTYTFYLYFFARSSSTSNVSSKKYTLSGTYRGNTLSTTTKTTALNKNSGNVTYLGYISKTGLSTSFTASSTTCTWKVTPASGTAVSGTVNISWDSSGTISFSNTTDTSTTCKLSGIMSGNNHGFTIGYASEKKLASASSYDSPFNTNYSSFTGTTLTSFENSITGLTGNSSYNIRIRGFLGNYIPTYTQSGTSKGGTLSSVAAERVYCSKFVWTSSFTTKATDTVTLTLASSSDYTGSDKNLISSFSTASKTGYVGLGSSSTSAPTSWSTSLSAKNAGTYYVWYKTDGNDNYNAIPATYKGSVTINKVSDFLILRFNSPTYNYYLQSLVSTFTTNSGTGSVALGTSSSTAPTSGWTTNISSVKGKDAGTYYVWYKSNGSTNYNAISPTCQPVTIYPKNFNTILDDLEMQTLNSAGGYINVPRSVDYTGNPIEPNIVQIWDYNQKFADDGSGVLRLNTDYTITYSNNTYVGTATITATGKGNFIGTYSETFTINRAKTAVEPTKTNRTYNGSAQNGYTNAGTYVTLAGTKSATHSCVTNNVTEFSFTATPDSNHAWSDGTYAAKTYTWVMNPKSIAVTWGTTTSWTYDGNSHVPTASASTGITGETMNLSVSGAQTNASSTAYTATASKSSVTNGYIGNYTLTNTTKSFTINKADSYWTIEPTLISDFTYNGTEKNLLSAWQSCNSNGFAGISDSDRKPPTSWGTAKATNAGIYYVWVKIDETTNYNATEPECIGIVIISQKPVTVTWSNLVTTYNGQPQAPSATVSGAVSGETISVAVKLGSVQGGQATQTNAGSYSISALPSVSGGQAKSANYDFGNQLLNQTFVINKKDINTLQNLCLLDLRNPTPVAIKNGNYEYTGDHQFDLNSFAAFYTDSSNTYIQLTYDQDYHVDSNDIQNDIDAGVETGCITIHGIGNYTSSYTEYFTINPRDISTLQDICIFDYRYIDELDVPAIENCNYIYNGGHQFTDPTDFGPAYYSDTEGRYVSLLPDQEYDFQNYRIENDVEAGYNTGSIMIFGIGNYTGSYIGYFTINPADSSFSLNKLYDTKYTLSEVNLSSYTANQIGSVTYKIKTNGTTTASTLSGSKLTLGAMSVSSDNDQSVIVTITDPGNSNYSGKSIDLTITVQKYTASFNFDNTTSYVNQGSTLSIKATATSAGGTVGSITYAKSNDSNSNATLSGTTLTGDKYSSGNKLAITATLAATTTVKGATITREIEVKDSTAPTPTISGGNLAKRTSQTVTLSASDNDNGSGVDKYYWGTSSTGTPNTVLTAPVSQPITQAGTYYLRVSDKSGNIGTTSIIINSYTINNLLETASGTTNTYTSANYVSASSGTYLIQKNSAVELANVYTNPHTTYCEFKGSSTTYTTSAATLSTSSITISNNGTTYYMWFNRDNLSVPTGTGTSLTYNGSSQGPTFVDPVCSHSGSTHYSTSGTRTATNADSYTATWSLSSTSYQKWSDKTTSAKSINWSIAPKSLPIPSSPAAKTYDGTSQSHGITVPSGSTIAASGSTTSAIDKGTYNVIIALNSTTNYKWSDNTTTNKTVSWTINPKSVAVTWGTTTSFTYNGSEQAPTASASSGVTGETINLTRGTQKNASSNAYTSTASIGSVTGGQGKASNYQLTGTTKSFTISPKTVGLSWGTTTWTYDGSSHSTTCTATGLVGSDTCTVTLTNNSVGPDVNTTGVTVTASALSNSNYALPANKTNTLKITVKGLSVTWVGQPGWVFTYTGSTQGPTPSVSNTVTGETVNLSVTLESEIGSYTAVVTIASVTGGRAKASNYSLYGDTQTYTIVGKPRLGSVAYNKIYLGATQVSAVYYHGIRII